MRHSQEAAALHPPLSSSFTKTWVAINRGHLFGLVASRNSAQRTIICVTITADRSAAACSHTEPMQQVSVSHREGAEDQSTDCLSLSLSLCMPAARHLQYFRNAYPTNPPLGHLSVSSRGRRSIGQIDTFACVFSLHSCSHYAPNPQIRRREALRGSIWVWDLPFTRCLSFFLAFLFRSVVTGVSERARGKNTLHFLFHPERCVCRESLKSDHSFHIMCLFFFLGLSQCDTCVFGPAHITPY